MEMLVAQVILLALASSFVSCYDPSLLQDFCVAVNETNRSIISNNSLAFQYLVLFLCAVFVNGKFCKDPKSVTASDFFTSGLNIAGNTTNSLGSNVTAVSVDRISDLNTLGVSLARFDFAPGGLNPPHRDPRATEIFVVLKGRLLVGFVSSNQDNNSLFSKVLNSGDVYVFPIGMMHFQMNIGRTRAVAFAGQNPGLITIANEVFGSYPPIPPEVVAKAFQLNINLVKFLQIVFAPE